MTEGQLNFQACASKRRALTGELDLATIADLFRQLVEDGSPRSVSAVLRIFREQSRGRHDEFAFGRGGALALPLVALLATIDHLSPYGTHGATFSALIFAGPSAYFAWRTRALIPRNWEELRELRVLTLQTLDAIVLSPWFVPQPLDREKAKLLQSLRRTNPEIWRRVSLILIGGNE